MMSLRRFNFAGGFELFFPVLFELDTSDAFQHTRATKEPR